jgi:hypothetical protein
MKLKLAVILPALALGLLTSAEAQQHRATRLGNPATRFAKRPPRKPDDVRVLLRSEAMKKDVLEVLNQAGWKGNAEDFDRAVASAEITEVQIPPGTRLPFMASRERTRRHAPHALMDVLWAGRKPIDAYAIEMTSNCVKYRIVIPKACGNFWFEETGKDTTSEQCAPPPPPPVVNVTSPGEACVTQPVEVTVNVQNPPKDQKVTVTANGKELTSGTLSNGSFRATLPGAPQPGTVEVTASAGGVTGRTSVTVKPCLPTCAITVSPTPAKAGRPVTVDVTGSRVAAGVQGGIRSAKVEIVRKDQVEQTVELTSPNLSRNDVVIKKSGPHTVRATVTDEAGQVSTNACQTDIDVKAAFPIFAGIYGGKERLTHDEASDHDDRVPFTAFSRCSPEVGIAVGVQPKIGDNAELEAAIGLKVPFDDDAHTTVFGDLAINRVLSRGFFGGGVSWWDIGKDSTGVGLLVQGGVDLDSNGKWQLVAQTRVPFFNQFDNIENNYQFWGGFRFRPNSWK